MRSKATGDYEAVQVAVEPKSILRIDRIGRPRQAVRAVPPDIDAALGPTRSMKGPVDRHVEVIPTALR